MVGMVGDDCNDCNKDEVNDGVGDDEMQEENEEEDDDDEDSECDDEGNDRRTVTWLANEEHEGVGRDERMPKEREGTREGTRTIEVDLDRTYGCNG